MAQIFSRSANVHARVIIVGVVVFITALGATTYAVFWSPYTTYVDVPLEQRNRYSLSDADVEQLARYALVIEEHYGRPMDIEGGQDGGDGQIDILQARPETGESQTQGRAQPRDKPKGRGQVRAGGVTGGCTRCAGARPVARPRRRDGRSRPAPQPADRRSRRLR